MNWLSIYTILGIIVLMLILFLCLRLSSYIKKLFKQFSTKQWLLIAGVFIFGLWLRFFLPDAHYHLFFDEPGYLSAGKDIFNFGYAANYHKSIGWPLLISGLCLFGEVDSQVVISVSIIIGSLMVIPVALAARKLFDFFGAFTAALIIALSPLAIYWSAGAENIILSVFVLSWVILFFISYIVDNDNRYLWLSNSFLAFAVLVRAENIFLVIPAFLTHLYVLKISGRKAEYTELLYPFSPLVLALPDFIKVFVWQDSFSAIASSSKGIYSGLNWSWDNFLYNSLNFLPNMLANITWAVVIMAFFGLVYWYYAKKQIFFYFMIWIVALWSVYAFSWLQVLGGRTRVYLEFFPVFTLAAASVFKFVSNNAYRKYLVFIPISIIIGYIGGYAALLNFKDPLSLFNTKLPMLVSPDLPENCAIVAPEHLLYSPVLKISVLRLQYYMQNRNQYRGRCLVFAQDWFCTRLFSLESYQLCQKFKQEHNLELWKEYSFGEIFFRYYKVMDK